MSTAVETTGPMPRPPMPQPVRFNIPDTHRRRFTPIDPPVRSIEVNGTIKFDRRIDGHVLSENLTEQQVEVMLQAALSTLEAPLCNLLNTVGIAELIQRAAGAVEALNAIIAIGCKEADIKPVSFKPDLLPERYNSRGMEILDI